MDNVSKEDRDDYLNKKKVKDRYIGYKGILISVKAKKDQIIDLANSKFQKERECLLIEGVYTIDSYKILKQFSDILKGEDKISKLLDKFSLMLYIKSDDYRYLIERILKDESVSKKIKIKFLSYLKLDIVKYLNIHHFFVENNYLQKSNRKSINIHMKGSIMYLLYLLIDLDYIESINLAQKIIDSIGIGIKNYILENNLDLYNWNKDNQEFYMYEFNKISPKLDVSKINNIKSLFKN
jgi:hypothetical protein